MGWLIILLLLASLYWWAERNGTTYGNADRDRQMRHRRRNRLAL